MTRSPVAAITGKPALCPGLLSSTEGAKFSPPSRDTRLARRLVAYDAICSGTMMQAAAAQSMIARAPLLPASPSDHTMGMPLPVPRLTIDMLDDLPEDGTRYELLDGALLVTPAPSFAHQIVATRLAAILVSALNETGATVVAIGAIQRGTHTQLQPDVLVCPPGVPPTASWREMRDWWLAVEVLSPSSRLYDREVKRGAYLALGVQEYWLVDPDSCSLERWTRAGSETLSASETLVWTPVAYGQAVEIDLREVFSDVCA